MGARSSRAARTLPLLGLALAGCLPDVPAALRFEVGDPVLAGGAARVEIRLGTGYVEGSLEVTLDGERVESLFARTADGAQGRLPAASGPHQLRADARFELVRQRVPRRRVIRFVSPAGAPALEGSLPVDGAAGVARSEWLRLDFAGAVLEETRASFELVCPEAAHPVAVHALRADLLVLNPEGELPGGVDCRLAWQAPDGSASLSFATAPDGPAARVVYDRGDPTLVAPLPDDFWLVPDASSPTGARVEFGIPEREPDVVRIFEALATATAGADGFSPIGAIAFELTDAPEPTSLPTTPEASLDPLASIGLFDLTPGSLTFGARVPFQLRVRSDSVFGRPPVHSLVLHPSIPLAPGGRYGLVVTRRALADASRPFDPSPFLAAALAPPTPGEAAEVGAVRALAADVLDAVAAGSALPIPAEDAALALRVSVATNDHLPHDLLAMKQQVLAADPPAFCVTGCPVPCPSCGVAARTGSVAAIVTGLWEAPDWRDGQFLARDANGDPVVTRTRFIPFTLALPAAARDRSVPVTLYQHGSPGSAEREVPGEARDYLAAAGFAVIGFTDPLNREIGQDAFLQTAIVVATLVTTQAIPDFWTETQGEQLAFLRMIDGLGTLDVLPLGAPDGRPDLDVTAPRTYVGISQGAIHGQALATYAPELRAAALVVGGSRLTETLIHQDSTGVTPLLPGLLTVFPNLRPPDVWAGLSLFQLAFDPQDSHNHAAFLYRDPVEVAGTTRKPSVLVLEGVSDPQVPNNSTRSLAWLLGPIPHLEPVQQAVPQLTPAAGPIRANVDAVTTSAFFQYVPAGVPGIPPTPGCVSQTNGHFCAQSAAESELQRTVFFQSALTDAAPVIVDPFAGP